MVVVGVGFAVVFIFAVFIRGLNACPITRTNETEPASVCMVLSECMCVSVCECMSVYRLYYVLYSMV